MKKFACVIITLILLCTCLAGCADDNQNADVMDESFPVLTDTRGTETKPTTVTTINGDTVTYDMNTRRIVCIFGSQDVVAFGIKLLAYEQTTEIKGYESFYEGAKKLNNSSPFSPEEVQSYAPELILVNQHMATTDVATLSKIAPVIPLYTDSEDFSLRVRYIGRIFGLEESAARLSDYATDLKTAMLEKMEALNLKGKTLTIYTYQGDVTIPPERGWFMNTIIYDYLGIERLDKVKEFMRDESKLAYEPIADEKLREYEGDLVIFAAAGDDKISTYVSENIGWKSLKAVRENRVGVIDMTYYQQKGVILLYSQYNEVYKALKAAAGIKD